LLINEIDWAWFFYPQVKRPVHEEIKKYLKGLDLEAILDTLSNHVGLTTYSLFLARISHQLVVDGVAAGLTLLEIATIIARVKEELPSPLGKPPL
jgi:hypothetical protein